MRRQAKERIEAAMAKPMPPDKGYCGDINHFDPWEDVIQGVYGSYASESDALMIEALKAIRDQAGFEFIDRHGFVAEFIIYLLAGHGYVEYGTSPRSGWPDPVVAPHWDNLIARWEKWYELSWGEPAPQASAATEQGSCYDETDPGPHTAAEPTRAGSR